MRGAADARFGMRGAELGRWGGRGGAAGALERIWEFLGISDGSALVCAVRKEEHGYLKFKAALPSGYCVL